MIAFACPSCDKAYTVDDKFAGKRTTCKHCKGWLTVPDAAADGFEVVDGPAASDFEVVDGPAAPRRARVVRAAAPPAASDFEVVDDPEDRPLGFRGGEGEAPPPDRAARVAARRAVQQARRQERIDEDFYRYRPSDVAVSRAVIGGIITMVFAAVWFVGGLAIGILFYFPPFLFIGGLVSLIRGLLGHEE